MVTNPMQRKARNSFLLGMAITLLITGCIIAFLIIQISNMHKKEQEVVYKDVLALKTDVKSGEIITGDKLTKITVNEEMVPADASSSVGELDTTYMLMDEQGNAISVDDEGNMSLEGIDNIQEIYTSGDEMYMMLGGEPVTVQSNNVLSDDDGEYIVITDEANDDHMTIFMDEEQGTFYRYELAQQNGQYTRVRRDVYLSTAVYVAKVDMKKNTVITPKLLAIADEQLQNDSRKVEVSTVILPAKIAEDGQIIDIRLRLPTGEDYIVVSKKEVETLELAEGVSPSTIYLQLNEIEIETFSDAVVEAAMIEGAYLYATEYIEAGMQEKPTPTYYPSGSVMQAIDNNPNITADAKRTLYERYNTYYTRVRERVEGNLTEDAMDNAYDGIEEEVATKQEQREEYLESLSY